MDATENNKLIAEFIGLKDGDKFLSPPLDEAESIGLGMYVSPDEMRYHASWDWLMPVIQEITNKTCDDEGWFVMNSCIEYVLSGIRRNDVKHTYTQVVKFIEWYNENK